MQFKHLTAVLLAAGITMGLNGQASADIRVTYAGVYGQGDGSGFGSCFCKTAGR